jgi:hypothetical protein
MGHEIESRQGMHGVVALKKGPIKKYMPFIFILSFTYLMATGIRVSSFI